MSNEFTLDIKQIKPESMNLFYEHLLKVCAVAKSDPQIYQKYLESKKGEVK